MSKTVAIIGAGITGILSAYYLSKAGYKVTVYEQEKYPAMRTSFANGGQVSVSNSEVWTTWSNVSKGIKWMFQKDAPLLIHPNISFDKINWLSKFLYYTFTDSYRDNTEKTIKLGLESRTLYKEIIEEENINFDQSYCGILHFYKDHNYFENACKVKNLYNSNGVEWDILSATEIVDLDPALKNVENIVGGAYTASDWTGDIHKFCIEFERVLREKYQVKFIFDFKFDKNSQTSLLNSFDKIVVSAGVGSKKIAELYGDKLDIYPVKGYSITITVKNKNLEYLPKVSLLDDQSKIVTSTFGNRFRVAGTAELDGENYDIKKHRIDPLIKWVHKNFPNLDTDNYSSWACLRPMTPNMLPIVTKSKKYPIYYHSGHGHLGWTLSPATVKQLIKVINE